MKGWTFMRRYIFLAVFAFAASSFLPLPAQAQYEMNRNMTDDELNEIHREVEALYGENPGLPGENSDDTRQERTDPANPQTLSPAAAAAIPQIKKTLQKIRQPPLKKPAANKNLPARTTGSDRRGPPAYQYKGSNRIR